MSERLIAGAVAVLALVAALPALGARSFWGDEAFSVGLVRQPWHLFWAYLWGQESNMALYYIGLRAWLAILDFSHLPVTELMIRLPSAAAAAGAVALVYLIGSRLLGRAPALVAAVLYGLNYLQLYQTLDARAYAFEMLLTNFGWYAVLRWRNQTDGGPWRTAYALSMAIAVYFHYYTLIVFAGQVVAVAVIAWSSPDRRRRSAADEVRRMAPVLILVLALTLPTLVDAAVHGGQHHDWVPPARITSFGALARDVAGYSLIYFIALTLAALIAVVAVVASSNRTVPAAGLVSAESWPHSPRGVLILLGCWIAIPPLATFAVTQPLINLHLFNSTYLVVVVPGVCLLAAMGALSFRSSAARLTASLLIVGCAATALPNYYAAAPRVDNRDLISWIAARHQLHDGLVTTSNKSSVVLDYYFGPNSPTPFFTDAYPGRLSWDAEQIDPASLSDAGIAAYADAHPRVFFVAYTPLFTTRLDPTAGSAMKSLQSRYRLLDQTVWRNRLGSDVWVQLYGTG